MPTWIPPVLFIATLIFLLFYAPWHYAGYFNGRYDPDTEED